MSMEASFNSLINQQKMKHSLAQSLAGFKGLPFKPEFNGAACSKEELIALIERERPTGKGYNITITNLDFTSGNSISRAPQELKYCNLSDLVIGERAVGKKIKGKIVSVPLKKVGVILAIEVGKSAIQVTFYNSVPLNATQELLNAKYAMGSEIVILEPYVKMYCPTFFGIRVDNPQDVVFSYDYLTVEKPLLASPVHLIEEGNSHFKKQNLELAYRYYTLSLSRADNEQDLASLARAYGNRSEVHLREGRWFAAWNDAESALKIESSNVKNHLRNGKALLELGLYEKAKTAFELSGEKHCAELCEKLIMQENGKFDFGKVFLQNENEPLADYVAPFIECVRLPNKGRGLIAKKDVKAGELLMVCKPIVHTSLPDAEDEELLSTQFDWERTKTVNSAGMQENVVKLCMKALDYPQFLYQLYVLAEAKVSNQNQNVSVNFNEYSASKLSELRKETIPSLDVNRVRGVIETNSFGGEGTSSLYFQSSFLNHSCTPNVRIVHPANRKMQILLAVRDVKEGEELTVSYFVPNIKDFSLIEDRKRMENWGFTSCGCDLCLLLDEKKHELVRLKQEMLPKFTKVKGKYLQLNSSNGKQIYSEVLEVENYLESELNKLKLNENVFARIVFCSLYILRLNCLWMMNQAFFRQYDEEVIKREDFLCRMYDEAQPHSSYKLMLLFNCLDHHIYKMRSQNPMRIKQLKHQCYELLKIRYCGMDPKISFKKCEEAFKRSNYQTVDWP